jgi:hypothetical protein
MDLTPGDESVQNGIEGMTAQTAVSSRLMKKKRKRQEKQRLAKTPVIEGVVATPLPLNGIGLVHPLAHHRRK